MPNARIAEFILRRATTPDRAAAIAGDLLEQHPHRPLLFAVAVARILLALQWRQILGFVAAAICFVLPAFAFARFALSYLTKETERHQRYAVTPTASPLLVLCMALFAVAVFAFAKPATRRVGLVSLSLALTDFLAACYIFINPSSHRYIMAAAFGVAILLAAIPATRRPGLISLASAAGLCATLLTVGIGAASLLHPHGRNFLRYDLGISALAWLSAIAAGTFTLNALQRRFAPAPPPVIN